LPSICVGIGALGFSASRPAETRRGRRCGGRERLRAQRRGGPPSSCTRPPPEGAGPGVAETVNWTGLLINSTYAPQTLRSALRRMAYFLASPLSSAFTRRRRMARRFHPTPNEMNVKRGSKPTAESTKTKEKLKNPQEPKTQAPESQEGLELSTERGGGFVAGVDSACLSREVCLSADPPPPGELAPSSNSPRPDGRACASGGAWLIAGFFASRP
jgi:hypothetical protein